MNQAIEAFANDIVTRGRREGTATFTRGCLWRLTGVKERGDYPLADITPSFAQSLYQGIVDQGYAAATHRADLKRGRMWFTWLARAGWVKGPNPFESVVPVGRPRKGKAQLRVDPARAFVGHCLDRVERDEGAVAALCALILNLRRGEIMSLRGPDVDDGGRLLWVDGGKTDNAKRHLEVPDVLAGHLVRLAKTAGQGRLFPHRAMGWLNDNVERLCREAGCERMTPHGLRGTHSTLAVRGGMSAHLVVDALGEVSRSMGHGSTRVTREHYVDPAALKARGTATLLRVLDGGSGRSSG